MATHCHITPERPAQTPAVLARPKAAPKAVLAAEQWNELHDFLTLALDALGDRPQDFSPDFLRNCVMHQRLAIQISHRAMFRLERTGGDE